MSIGKYVTNLGVLGAAVSALGVLRQTRTMAPDWRRSMLWVVWLAGLVLAIAGVAKRDEDRRYEELREDS